MPRTEQTEDATSPIPLVTIGWIHPFLEILEEVGAPFDAILERAQLPSLSLDDPSTLVPTTKIYRFVAMAASETEMPDLGLLAGSRLDLDSLLPDAERSWIRPGVFRSVKNFIGVALETSSNVELWIDTRPGPEPVTEFFYLGTFGTDHPAFPAVEQYMVALMVRWIRYGTIPRWNPNQVNLRAASVPEATLRSLVGDAEIRSEQTVTSIVFPAQSFMGPLEDLPRRGSSVWKRHRDSLRSATGSRDLAASLRVVLPAYLPDGSPTIQQAANLAGTSVRTLQRRLDEEDVTYSQLLEDLRHDLAIYLMRDSDRDISAVSRELGYRDPAIFTRAFRRWTGQTPSQYRRKFPT